MFAQLVFALALALPGQTPDDHFRTAWEDLTHDVKQARWRYTRYLSLAGIPRDRRALYVNAMAYGLNATSFHAVLCKPVVIADPAGVPQLLRIDLADVEWDYGARYARLAELERRGVNFGLKDDEARRLFLDPWERFAVDQPYSFANYEKGGTIRRGWIDPILEAKARSATNSVMFVIRADWLLSHILVEKDEFRGYYSTLLMHPAKEADLYKVLAIDIKAVDRQAGRLRHGGAVVESNGVALNNRALELVPNAYGMPISYLWRTLDVDEDSADLSVLVSLGGTLKHKGREILYTLPNGLLGTYLANGDGVQVAVVPEKIAQVKTPFLPVRDTRVVGGYKCIECHREGIKAFDDVIRPVIEDLTTALAVNYESESQRAEAAALASFLDDYHRSPLQETIRLEQAVYAGRLFAACGMTGDEVARAVVGAVEGYPRDPVTSDQAALEMGYPVDRARDYWRAAVDERFYQTDHLIRPNPILVALSRGQSITRGAWEASFGDAMRAVKFAWDNPIQVPAPVPAKPAARPAPPRAAVPQVR